ncbi:MAG: YggT family protein [SAR202 cluster bacterium]|nr:YggT family protein [SAR202 cluster bacterium]
MALLFISYLLQLLGFLIIARSLLSWFPDIQGNMLVQILRQVTDPILLPLQRIVPRVGMFDFSPMIAVIVLFFLAELIRSRAG